MPFSGAPSTNSLTVSVVWMQFNLPCGDFFFFKLFFKFALLCILFIFKSALLNTVLCWVLASHGLSTGPQQGSRRLPARPRPRPPTLRDRAAQGQASAPSAPPLTACLLQLNPMRWTRVSLYSPNSPRAAISFQAVRIFLCEPAREAKEPGPASSPHSPVWAVQTVALGTGWPSQRPLTAMPLGREAYSKTQLFGQKKKKVQNKAL